MAYPSNQPDYVSIESLSAEDKKKVKNCIRELNDSMTRAAAEKDFQKEAINKINEELGVEKKMIRRMAKAYFMSNYKEVVEENKKFEDYYESIVDGTL